MGTVVQEFTKPLFKNTADVQLVTAIFGNLVKSAGKGRFKLSNKDGTLQVKGYKLYPMGSNIFKSRKDVALFVQLYSQKKDINLEPEFSIFHNRGKVSVIPGRLIDRLWDKDAHVWKCVYSLDFSTVQRGEFGLELNWIDSSVEREAEDRIHFRII
jgi:hypothetical protein